MPFRDVIGHRRIVGLLSRSLQHGSLPPSLILEGPSGIGKRLVSIASAQALNCSGTIGSAAFTIDSAGNRGSPPSTIEFDACGICSACTRIARNVHADVLVVEPGENGSIKIEQVREIVDRAAYRPFEGRRRVVIIDEADALVPAAQNALLKTLEEPPSSSVFMLITSRPEMLLPTVRSRCPRLRFRPLSTDEVAAALVKRGRTAGEAHAVAGAAAGSIGRALEASAGELVEARDIAVRVLSQAAATGPRQHLGGLEAAKELLTGTGAGGASDREQLASHLRAMASLLRDVEVLAAGASEDVLANPDVRPELERLSAYRGERGIRAFEAVDRALVALDSNAGIKIVADWVALNV